jgi:hypothetical protein
VKVRVAMMESCFVASIVVDVPTICPF